MHHRSTRIPTTLATMLAVLCATACSADVDTPATAPESSAAPHGYIEGAEELSEPPLSLTTVTSSGELGILDLLTGTSSTLGSLDSITAAHTDGRFLFASSSDRGAVDIVDTGAWTVDHEDHQHFYSAAPRVLGSVTGVGHAEIATGSVLTAVHFNDARSATILDTAALGDGEMVTTGTIDDLPSGSVVAVAGDTVLVAGGPGEAAEATEASEAAEGHGDSDGAEASLVVAYDRNGAARTLDGVDPVECAAPASTVTTRVGTVIGCADGALLATQAEDGSLTLEMIFYPPGTPATHRAQEFSGRKGRPTVAALGDTGTVWLLDTRQRAWTRLSTEPLLTVTAVNDAEGHLVGVSTDGRAVLLDPADGATLADTTPLLARTASDPDALALLSLTVDSSRAYLTAPAEGQVIEIDYADNVRIARTFDLPGVAFAVETGL